ncbi:CPXCG motif-containing cysteine-rich protein [Flocculibacter collagenilyticus]|uniref:CPXCG motif-containing cysteine-rich protein n=1 Tax=Flocculibacter collagenilyticus TaxID=2744479 RepID=UPI0018F2C095|nr:CPXCG motif-containing cysteine-rich protein [Flocculibacter collagenilyticus]
MLELKSQTIECPHCGHHIHVTIDSSQGDQDYFEDCSACCNPIRLKLHIDEVRRKLELYVDSDDEQVF